MKDPRAAHPLVLGSAMACLAFIILPLPFIILFAFSTNHYTISFAGGISFEWFESFFSNARFMAALKNSLLISAIACVTSLVLALPTAILAVRHEFVGKQALLTFVSAPLLVPGVIVGTAALGFVAEIGVGPGFWPITVAMIALTLPLTVRPIIGNLAGLPDELEAAARNLGASRFTAFRTVTLPQLVPGIVAGATFAFVETMDNFAITAFLTSISTTTLPIEAYSYIRDIDDPTVAAMATVLIVLSIALVFIIERLVGLDKFLND